MGLTTGWTFAAVVGMISVPGIVALLSKAVNGAFKAMFDGGEGTVLAAIRTDMDHGADKANPLAWMLLMGALVVALGFAAIVFAVRNLAILAWVCSAPLVLASLARAGDTRAVKAWVRVLLGLIFAPFAMILITPLVAGFQGALIADAVLLCLADVIMLRMIFHGIPYFGPRIGHAVRDAVEQNTSNRVARAVVKAGVPTFYENENTPRQPRTVDTPGRAASQHGALLAGAFGIRAKQPHGQLTTRSAIDKAEREAPRRQQVTEARRQAHLAAAAANPRPPAGGGQSGPGPAPGPSGGPRPPRTPAPAPVPNPSRGAPPPPRTP
ncbi:hypothetical protein [Streptomyces sp. NBC_01264]|uniref:hypothetical protein n=1 Tax=Streptomyces sp. NBC_01264 TaxID=2903804 RepID=UPI002257456F|nr:hypothetical protein [Streptomyces sp. NBC_01264]MCX4784574.1 hypothetical protein [Streptomyces sp. NBC_01264]